MSVTPAAADDVATAQKRANAAAQKLAEANTELAQIEDDIVKVEADQRATEAELVGLRSAVQETAVRSYIHAGGADLPFLLGGDLNAEVRANALARFVTMGSFDQIDRYRALQADLESGAALLADRKAAQGAAVEQLNATRASALKELARLQELQRKREQAAAAQRARAAASAAAASRRTSTSRGVVPQIMGGSWLCPVVGAARVRQRLRRLALRRAPPRGQRHPRDAGHADRRAGRGHGLVPERLARWALVLPRGRRWE